MNQFLQYTDYHYALLCRVCSSKVIDPDKKKNQVFFDGICPTCGEESKEVKKTKKQLKLERKEAIKAANRGR
jgi:hypothetical protein